MGVVDQRNLELPGRSRDGLGAREYISRSPVAFN